MALFHQYQAQRYLNCSIDSRKITWNSENFESFVTILYCTWLLQLLLTYLLTLHMSITQYIFQTVIFLYVTCILWECGSLDTKCRNGHVTAVASCNRDPVTSQMAELLLSGKQIPLEELRWVWCILELKLICMTFLICCASQVSIQFVHNYHESTVGLINLINLA